MDAPDAIDVLLVEDSSADAQLVLDTLACSRSPAFRVRHVTRVGEALRTLSRQPADVVVLDLVLPDAHRLDGVEMIREAAPESAIVVRTGFGDERLALEALEAGAQDYIIKSVGENGRALERAILYAHARQQAERSTWQLAAIVESSDDAIVGLSPDGTITTFNPGAQRLYGHSSKAAIGQSIELLIAEDRLEEERGLLPRVVAGERLSNFETRHRRRGGTTVEVSVAISAVVDERERVVGISMIARDISQRRQWVAAVLEAEERFRRAFDEAPIGMGMLTLEGTLAEVNDAFCRITGYARRQLEGLGIDAITHPHEAAAQREGLAELVSGRRGSYRGEARYIHAAGQSVTCALYATVLRDGDGKPKQLLAQLQDVSDQKRHEAQLEYLADHDGLTGLPNRRAFARSLADHAVLVERYGGAGCVLMIDLDNFKVVNDTLGHRAGDELIAVAGRLIAERLRSSDALARLGGDEFGVLLPKAGPHDGARVAESLLETLRFERVPLAGATRRITASIGIASFSDAPELTAEDVLANADLAMYDAKDDGRDRVAVFSAGEPQARTTGRMTWARRLERALANDRFVLVAQPIVDLRTRMATQYELLLRMQDDNGQLIPASVFLSVAERFDLIQQIDAWVVSAGIPLLAEVARRVGDVALEINLSARSLSDDFLLERIEYELADAAVRPESVIFEITETAAVANIASARAFTNRLADLGCRFALDDFGAGFGSFYYLKHLAFDFLKIDGEFVRGCASSKTDRLVIGAVVEIARGLGKRTIAEYVEDEQTMELLASLGVDYAQGFHLGRPSPITNELVPG